MRCKNSPAKHPRYYTGNEPSPKGRGYCAQSERVGTRMRGKDRRVWVVRKDSLDRKRWVRAVAKKKRTQTYRQAHRGFVYREPDLMVVFDMDHTLTAQHVTGNTLRMTPEQRVAYMRTQPDEVVLAPGVLDRTAFGTFLQVVHDKAAKITFATFGFDELVRDVYMRLLERYGAALASVVALDHNRRPVVQTPSMYGKRDGSNDLGHKNRMLERIRREYMEEDTPPDHVLLVDDSAANVNKAREAGYRVYRSSPRGLSTADVVHVTNMLRGMVARAPLDVLSSRA